MVEDHNIIRASLQALIERRGDLHVVGATSNGEEAVSLAERLKPDVVIMDVVLRGSNMTGMQATREITRSRTGCKVLALSVMEDLAYVKGMLAAGASGYLFKGCSEDELLEAIQAVLAGETYFSEEARHVIQEDYVNLVQKPPGDAPGELTDREREVLRLTALGQSSKSIAADLNISRKTVDAHRRKVMEKLDIWSVAELTKYALRERIILDEE